MLVEHMSGLIEQMEEELKGMRNNKVNIDFLKEQVSKLQTDVEKLIRNGRTLMIEIVLHYYSTRP